MYTELQLHPPLQHIKLHVQSLHIHQHCINEFKAIEDIVLLNQYNYIINHQLEQNRQQNASFLRTKITSPSISVIL